MAQEQILKNPHNQWFKVRRIAEDGECAYAAYGTTRSDAYEKISALFPTAPQPASSSSQPAVTQERAIAVLKPAILSLFDTEKNSELALNFVNFVIDNGYLKNDTSTLTALSEALTLFNSEDPEGSSSSFDAFSGFVENPDICRAFIDFDIRDKKIQGGYGNLNVLLLLAEMDGCELHIWNSGKEANGIEYAKFEEDAKFYNAKYQPENSTAETVRKDLFFTQTANKAPHFNVLELQKKYQPQPVVSPAPSSPSSSLSSSSSSTPSSPKKGQEARKLPFNRTTLANNGSPSLGSSSLSSPVFSPYPLGSPAVFNRFKKSGAPGSPSSPSVSSSASASPLFPSIQQKKAQERQVKKDEDEDEVSQSESSAKGYASDAENESGVESVFSDAEEGSSIDSEELPSELTINRAGSELLTNLVIIEKWLGENNSNNQAKIQQKQLENYALLLTLVQDPNNPYLNQLIEIVGDELRGERCFGQKFDDASKTLAEILENSIAARLEAAKALENDKNKNELIEQQSENLKFAALVFRATNSVFSQNKNNLLAITQEPDNSKSFFGKETAVIELNFNYIREAAQADELIKGRLLNANKIRGVLSQAKAKEADFLQALQFANREAIDSLLKEEAVEWDEYLQGVVGDAQNRQLCFGEDADWIAIVLRYAGIDQLKLQYLRAFHNGSEEGQEKAQSLFIEVQKKNWILANEIISKPEFGDADDELLKIINDANACQLFFGEDKNNEDKIAVFALKLRAKKLKDFYKDRNNNAAEIARIQKENLDMAKRVVENRSKFSDAYNEVLAISDPCNFGTPLFFGLFLANSKDEALVETIILENLLQKKEYTKLLSELQRCENNPFIDHKAYLWSAYTHISTGYPEDLKGYEYDLLGKQDKLIAMTNNLISGIKSSKFEYSDRVSLIHDEILKKYRYSDELNLLTQAIKNYHKKINKNFRYVDSDRDGQLKRLLNLKAEYRVDGPKSIREVKNKLAFLQELRKIQEEIQRVQEPKGQYSEDLTTGKKVFKSELWQEIDAVIQKIQNKNYDFITTTLWPSDLNEEKSAYFKLFDAESKYNLFVGNKRKSSYEKHQYEDGYFLAKQFLDNQNDEGYVFLLRHYQNNQNYLLGIKNALIDGLKKSTIPVNQKTANMVINLLGAIEKSRVIVNPNKTAYKLDVFSAFLNAAKPVFSDADVGFEDKLEALNKIDKVVGGFQPFPGDNKAVHDGLEEIITNYVRAFGENYLSANSLEDAQALWLKFAENTPKNLKTHEDFIFNLLNPYSLVMQMLNLQDEKKLYKTYDDQSKVINKISELALRFANLPQVFFDTLGMIYKKYFLSVLEMNDTETLINLLNGKPNIATEKEIKEWADEYLEAKNKDLSLSDYQCLMLAFSGRKDYEPLLKTIKRLSPINKLKNNFLAKVSDLMGDKAKLLLDADSAEIDALGKLAKEIADVATQYPGLRVEVKAVSDEITKRFYDVYANMLECRLDVVEDPVVVVIDKKNPMPKKDKLEPNKLYVYEEKNKSGKTTVWYGCKTQKGHVVNRAINRDNLGYDLGVFQIEDNDASAYTQLTNTEETKKKFIAEQCITHQPTFIRLNAVNGPVYFLYQNNDVRQVHDNLDSPVFENIGLWNSNQSEVRHVRVASVGKYKDIYAQLKNELNVDIESDVGYLIQELKSNNKPAQQSIIALARASGHFAESPVVRPDSYRLEQQDLSAKTFISPPAKKSKILDESEKLPWELFYVGRNGNAPESVESVSIAQIPGMVEVLKNSSTVAYSPDVKKRVTDCLTSRVRSTNTSFVTTRADVMAKVNDKVIKVLNPESKDREMLSHFQNALAEYPKEYFEAIKLLNKFNDYDKAIGPNKERFKFTENDYIQLVELLRPAPVPPKGESKKPSKLILLTFVIKRYLVEKRIKLPEDPTGNYSLFRIVMLAVQKGQRFDLKAHLEARKAVLSNDKHRHHNEVVTLAKHYDYENYKNESAVKASVENKIKQDIKDILEARELHKKNQKAGKVIYETSPFASTQIARLEKMKDFFGNDEGQKKLYLEAVKAMKELEAYIQPFLSNKDSFAYQENFNEIERLSVYMAQEGVFNFDEFMGKKSHPEKDQAIIKDLLDRFSVLYVHELEPASLRKLKLIIETRAHLLHNVMNLKIDSNQNKKLLAYYQLSLLSTKEISGFFTNAYDSVEENKAENEKTTQNAASSSSSTSTSTSSSQQKPKSLVVFNKPECERREYWLCLVSDVKMREKTGTQLFCENYLLKLSVKDREAFFDKAMSYPFSFECRILQAIKTDEDKKVIIKVYEDMVEDVEFSKAKNFAAIARSFENTARLRKLLNVNASFSDQNTSDQASSLNQLLTDIAKLDADTKDISSIKTRIAELMTNGSLGSLAYVLSDFYQHPNRFFALFCPAPQLKTMIDVDSFVCGIISREDLWNQAVSGNNADKYMDCYKVMVEKMLYGVGNMEIARNNFRTLSEAKKKFDEMKQNSKITPGSFGAKLFATQCIGGVLPESEAAFSFERDKRAAKKIIAEKAEDLKKGTAAEATNKCTVMLQISVDIGRANSYKELQKVFSDAREEDGKLESKAKCLTKRTLAEFEKAEDIAQRFERDKRAAKEIIAEKAGNLRKETTEEAKSKSLIMQQISVDIDQAENYEELQKVFYDAREANKQLADREFEKAENIAYQCSSVNSQNTFSPSRSSSSSSSSCFSPNPKTPVNLITSPGIGSPIISAGSGASAPLGGGNVKVSEEPSAEFKALITNANKILSAQKSAISGKPFSLSKMEDQNKIALLDSLMKSLSVAKNINDVNVAFDTAKNTKRDQKKVLDGDTEKVVKNAEEVFATMQKPSPAKKL